MASSLAIPVVLSPVMNASTSRRAGAAKFSLNGPTDEVGAAGASRPEDAFDRRLPRNGDAPGLASCKLLR